MTKITCLCCLKEDIGCLTVTSFIKSYLPGWDNCPCFSGLLNLELLADMRFVGAIYVVMVIWHINLQKNPQGQMLITYGIFKLYKTLYFLTHNFYNNMSVSFLPVEFTKTKMYFYFLLRNHAVFCAYHPSNQCHSEHITCKNMGLF